MKLDLNSSYIVAILIQQSDSVLALLARRSLSE